MSQLGVSVSRDGTVLLGENVACDGYALGKRVGVVSHFHSDHTFLLSVALRFCEFVLCTLATRELLLITEGDGLPPYLDRLKGLHYTETIKFDGDRITLFPAKHVLGAAQVLVETDEGNRLLYSGDFLVPGTLPPEADVLVVEAAYGWPPLSRRCCRESAISYLVSLVKRLLSGGAIAIVAYQGKLQEAMNILVEGEVDVPFLAPADVYDVAQVYRKFGVEVGDCLSLGTPEANEVLKGPCVIFVSDPKEIPNDITRIYLDGRCTIPLHRLDSHRYVIGLSTHADSDGLLRYIEKSKARVVVIDGVRHAHASLLAQLVEKKLGIKCTVMPS